MRLIRRWPMYLGLILGLAALWLGLRSGTDPVDSWRLAARWTARIGLPVFIITYAASSLGRLWPSPLTRSIWRDRRWWGLGFAAAHTVHLAALIAFLKVSGETRPPIVFAVAGTGYALMYAMVLTSDEAAMRALGKNWRRLHTLGIHWLWFVFFASYAGRIMKPDSMMTGLVGTAVVTGALALRIAVWLKGRGRQPAAA